MRASPSYATSSSSSEHQLDDGSYVLRRLQARLQELEAENEELRAQCDTNDDLLGSLQANLEETSASAEDAETRVRELELQLDRARRDISFSSPRMTSPSRRKGTSEATSPLRMLSPSSPLSGLQLESPAARFAAASIAADVAGHEAEAALPSAGPPLMHLVVVTLVATFQLGLLVWEVQLMTTDGVDRGTGAKASACVSSVSQASGAHAAGVRALLAVSILAGLAYATATGSCAAMRTACLLPFICHLVASVGGWAVGAKVLGFSHCALNLAMSALTALAFTTAADRALRAKTE